MSRGEVGIGMRPHDARGPQTASANPSVAALPSILMRTSRDITSALQSLYRSHDFLKQAAVQRLTGTRDRLTDLSSTTENATHRLLDGLDNALVLIDELGREPSHGSADTERLHGQLREEVHGLITSLQFQDIVAQQIAFAVHVLEDTETRVHRMAEHLATVFGDSVSEPGLDDIDNVLDPGASTLDGEGRQDLADSIFSGAL